MTVIVRTAARRRHPLRRLAGRGRAVLGGLLLAVAATMSVSLAIGIVPLIGGIMDDRDGSPLTGHDRVLLDRLERAWVIALVLVVSGWATGRWLLRGRRHMVVWLRRFRDPDEIRVVSSALDHIGRSWRVVTLDDATAAPVGTAAGLRVATEVADDVAEVAPKVLRVLISFGTFAMRVCFAVLVAMLAWTVSQGGWGALEQFLPNGSGGRSSAERTLVWAALAILAGLYAVMLAGLVSGVGMIPGLGLAALVGRLGRGVRQAEVSKSRFVRSTADVATVTSAVDAASAELVAPRLTVLKVDTPFWQPTVTALADRASAVVVDVSHASDNLLWEVEQMAQRMPTRTVFVGRRDLLAELAGGGSVSQLARVLDGREVLAYSTGLIGRARFQRALLSDLESTVPPSTAGARDVVRWLFVLAGVVTFALAVRAAVLLVAG